MKLIVSILILFCSVTTIISILVSNITVFAPYDIYLEVRNVNVNINRSRTKDNIYIYLRKLTKTQRSFI